MRLGHTIRDWMTNVQNYVKVSTLYCRGTKDPNEVNAGNLNTADPSSRAV